MSNLKPGLPQGTRDFAAETVYKRQFIFNTIRQYFELYGFSPLETPAFENLETLTGKYGEEGDKLMFKILNNGLERPEKYEQAKNDFEEVLKGKSKKGITERAMRYDLTIPFARYVAMNQGQLTFPFKRYQIQQVWRADKPQRGRYREFYQCDADIVGSESLWNENELIQLYTDVFNALNIPVSICINNRKILAALADQCGGQEWLIPITVAIDKLDKIGLDGVMKELQEKAGLSEEQQLKVQAYLQISQSASTAMACIEQLRAFLGNDLEGIRELQYLAQSHPHIQIDVTLARGLNYYTGTILEVKPTTVKMGSIGGGGRYDNLTGLFGVPDIAGVGISFGVDRIYDVMEELQLFPATLQSQCTVMLVNFGTTIESRNREVLATLRKNKISAEMFPEAIKFDKQLKYAHKKQIPFVVMIGEDELKENLLSVKDFRLGTQQKISLEELPSFIRKTQE
jgi:histidyl-tRNA synthetase